MEYTNNAASDSAPDHSGAAKVEEHRLTKSVGGLLESYRYAVSLGICKYTCATRTLCSVNLLVREFMHTSFTFIEATGTSEFGGFKEIRPRI